MKSTKHYLLFYFLVCSIWTSAQLSIQFNGINQYFFSVKEAANVAIVNSGPNSIEIKLYGQIFNEKNEKVVDFVSNSFIVSTGANIITPLNPGLSEINYSNQVISEIEAKTGVFPSGAYRICVWTSCVDPDCGGLGKTIGVVESPPCVMIQVENPTPLLLSYPNDQSEIDENRPIYTWIPPAPLSGLQGLNYRMRLVEMYSGQTKADALLMNRPLIELDGHSVPMFSHPPDIDALDTGKWYAWQVEASVGDLFVGKSEQWKFKLKQDTIKEKKQRDEMSYVEIKGQSGASIFYAVRYLKLKHVVRLEQGNIHFQIKNNKGENISISNQSFQIQPGDNRLAIDLSSELKFKDGEEYSLTGTLLNGELFVIRFIYLSPKTSNE